MNLDDPQIRTSWLDDLQVRSWNLELIISGISIILLLSTIEEFHQLHNYLFSYLQVDHVLLNILRLFTDFFYIGLNIFLINLILNMILRGLWIGAIGLRSVGDPDRDISKKFHPQFQTKLSSDKIDLDVFIVGLDRLCSTIFSFTFLSVFIIISFTFSFGMFFAIQAIKGSLGVTSTWVNRSFGIFALFYFFILLLYFIDFVSLGGLKKVRWLGRVYFPFYRIMGYITLAFLYRNLYYNLINRKFSRRLALLLVPYIILVIYVSSLELNFHPLFFKGKENQQHYLSVNLYDDSRPEEEYIEVASIPSRNVSNNYLPLFIAYNPSFQADLDSICPEFVAPKSVGLRTQMSVNVNGNTAEHSTPDEGLVCLSSYFHVCLNDSLIQDPGFVFYIHPSKEEKGLFTMLSVHDLPMGKHHLDIYHLERENLDSLGHHLAMIPFWK